MKTPPAIRTLPDGTKVDDRGYHLDADGYRLDRRSKIIGEVEYDAKAQSTVSSNAVAGYYISSENRVAGGTVAVPSEGAGAGALPTSASYTTTTTSNVPRGTSNVPYAVPSTAPATTTPVPLAPPATR